MNNYQVYSASLNNGLISLGVIKIFQGVVTNEPFQSTDANAKCLISYLEYNDKAVLIPGDALYKNFPVFFTPNHLVIPHHGCKYSIDGRLPNIDEDKVTKSFVFCGPSKRYKHPNLTHLDHFHKKEGQTICRFFSNPALGGRNKVFKRDKAVPKNEDYTICSHKKYLDW